MLQCWSYLVSGKWPDATVTNHLLASLQSRMVYLPDASSPCCPVKEALIEYRMSAILNTSLVHYLSSANATFQEPQISENSVTFHHIPAFLWPPSNPLILSGFQKCGYHKKINAMQSRFKRLDTVISKGARTLTRMNSYELIHVHSCSLFARIVKTHCHERFYHK